MKLVGRGAANAAALLILTLVGTPAWAQGRGQSDAQRGGQPNPDTPNILVAPFLTPTRQLAVEVADAVRSRIQSEHSAKELYATPKVTMENALRASGFPVDSALSASDVMDLAKIVHADYVVDGKATKAAAGVHVEPRLISKTGTQVLVQPLPVVDGKDAGDVAKTVERSVADALKGMAPYKLCINDLRAQKWDQAVKDGGLALVAYSNSTLARICLLQAYDHLNMTDSVISTALAILAKDSTSALARVNAADAYAKKGEAEKSADLLTQIWQFDPTNLAAAKAAIAAWVKLNKPEKAMPIVQTMLAQSPGDADLLRTKWLVQLAAGSWKQAIATGEELAKADPSAATIDYYNRQIGAAQKDSNAAKTQEFAVKAAAKFPTDASLQVLMAQGYRKNGQLPEALKAARRAIELDSKNSNAWLFAVATAKDLNQPDTAMALAVKGIAAGADKAALEPFLLGPVGAAVKKAQDSKERADWEAAFKAAQVVDGMAPSAATKFFLGLSSFQVGLDALQNAQKLGAEKGKDAKETKAKACSEAKVAEDMWAIAQVAILPGGAYNKDGAGQVMAAIQQYGEFIPQMKKSYCPAK